MQSLESGRELAASGPLRRVHEGGTGLGCREWHRGLQPGGAGAARAGAGRFPRQPDWVMRRVCLAPRVSTWQCLAMRRAPNALMRRQRAVRTRPPAGRGHPRSRP